MSRWLTLDEVRLLHRLALELDGGSPGLINPGALEAALAQAQAGSGEILFHPTLPEQAAAYLFHICQAHAFTDGNKRTAVLASLTFLQLNGLNPSIDPEALFDLTLRVAQGRVSKKELTQLLVTDMA